jgi:hypothetical protein
MIAPITRAIRKAAPATVIAEIMTKASNRPSTKFERLLKQHSTEKRDRQKD